MPNPKITQYILLVVLILSIWLILKITKYLFKKTKNILVLFFKKKSEDLKIQSLSLASSQSIEKALHTFLEVIHLLINISIILISIPLFLRLFPEGSQLSKKVAELIWGPVKKLGSEIINYIPNFVDILIILIFSYYLTKIFKILLKGIEQKSISISGFYAEWAGPTSRILTFFIWVLTIARVVPLLPGAGSDEFKGVTLVLTGLFSLGSASSISNITSGFLLHYLRSMKLGDFVKIQDVVGEVVEMGLLVTRVRNYQNLVVAIPNAEILKSNISNFTKSISKNELAIPISLSIGYDIPCEKVHSLLKFSAEKSEGVKKYPEPYIVQKKLDDFYISYELNFYLINIEGLTRTISNVLESIQHESVKRNIPILSPHYSSVEVAK